MTTVRRMSAVLCFLVLSIALASAESLDGREVFVNSNCNTCHSVEAQGIEKIGELKFKGGDLSRIGDKRKKPEWLKSYLKGEVKGSKGLRHDQKAFEGMIFEGLPGTQFTGTDEELEALVNWLVTLKKPRS